VKEGWKNGRMEEWKNGRVEGWKNGELEGWRTGELDSLIVHYSLLIVREGWRIGDFFHFPFLTFHF
jgi:hypothetical protein